MIESYGFGKITIDGKTYTSDVIIYSDSVQDGWRRKEGHKLCLNDLKDVLEIKPDVLIVGTGASGLMIVLPEVEQHLRENNIELIILPTEEASRTYNKLSKTKRVIAAFHLTC